VVGGGKEEGGKKEGGRVPRLITNMTIFYACGWGCWGRVGFGGMEVGKWGVGVEWSGVVREGGERRKEEGEDDDE